MPLEDGEKDAQIWRSDTLRRLRPRTRVKDDTGPAAVAARNEFDEHIVQLSRIYAQDFVNSPAKFLMKNSNMDKAISKVSEMFWEAARLSYELWTQRTFIRVITLHELDAEDRVFDLTNPRLKLNSLVRHEKHQDGLQGRLIGVVVHPIVDVYGDWKGENYDKRGTWVAGEVWVDSAVDS
jgi:hypothetical protein